MLVGAGTPLSCRCCSPPKIILAVCRSLARAAHRCRASQPAAVVAVVFPQQVAARGGFPGKRGRRSPVAQINRCVLQCLLQSQCLVKQVLFSCGKSGTKIASAGGITHSVSSAPQRQDALQTNCVVFFLFFFYKVKQHFSIQTLPVLIAAAISTATNATQTAQHLSGPRRFTGRHRGPSSHEVFFRGTEPEAVRVESVAFSFSRNE